jgi:hypothetical protein
MHGEHVNLDDPNVQILTQYLGDPIETGTGELRFMSPFRDKFRNPTKEDRKRHLYVNMKKAKFFCFKSSMAGSLSYLFFLIGADLQAATPRNESLDVMRKRLVALDEKLVFNLPKAELPEWYTPVMAGSTVHRYLHSRGVPDEDIEWYQIGEGEGEMTGWLVVPNFNQAGECEYWVARDTRKKTYHNPSVDRRFHVLFLDKALEYSPGTVTVCEGIFSAIAAGRDAVAALGKFVTDDQIRRMWSAGVRKVNLALDGDAWKETLDTAERCLKIGLEVHVLSLPSDQDPADMGRDSFNCLKKMGSIEVSPLNLTRLKLAGIE